MKNIRTAIPPNIITNTTAEATPATKAAMSAREASYKRICVHVYMYIVYWCMVQFIPVHKKYLDSKMIRDSESVLSEFSQHRVWTVYVLTRWGGHC